MIGMIAIITIVIVLIDILLSVRHQTIYLFLRRSLCYRIDYISNLTNDNNNDENFITAIIVIIISSVIISIIVISIIIVIIITINSLLRDAEWILYLLVHFVVIPLYQKACNATVWMSENTLYKHNNFNSFDIITGMLPRNGRCRCTTICQTKRLPGSCTSSNLAMTWWRKTLACRMTWRCVEPSSSESLWW